MLAVHGTLKSSAYFSKSTTTKHIYLAIVLLFRQEIKGTGVKLINILPGFVDTEGIREVFSNEYSAGVMKEYGYGDIESIRSAC